MLVKRLREAGLRQIAVMGFPAPGALTHRSFPRNSLVLWGNAYYRSDTNVLPESSAMKTLSLKLPDELDARISAIARQRGSSKSEIVRDALDAYLARETKAHQGSALDLAADLVGSLEGPADLSHHDDHMRGYGE